MTTELIEVRQVRIDELIGEKRRARTGQGEDAQKNVSGRIQKVGGKISLKKRKHIVSSLMRRSLNRLLSGPPRLPALIARQFGEPLLGSRRVKLARGTVKNQPPFVDKEHAGRYRADLLKNMSREKYRPLTANAAYRLSHL